MLTGAATVARSEAPPYGHKARRTLLVVDDDPQIQRLLVRCLARDFDEILVAGTPAEAERLLVSHAVTHVVTDYDLGAGHPRGTALVEGWRCRYRSIELAVLLTGSLPSRAKIPPAVDRCFTKGADLEVLRSALTFDESDLPDGESYRARPSSKS